MIPSIQTNIQIDGGDEYLGWAQQRLSAMERSRLETGAPLLSQTFYPATGVEVYVRASATGNLIRITGGGSGFVCHPRDQIHPAGLKPDGAPLVNAFPYPLVDDDHGNRILSKNGETWEVDTEPENYGNLDWIGPNGEVVSWRGPSGRQLPMDDTLHFPGFTEWDYTTISGGLETEHYTPFRNLVYQGGEVIKEFLYGYKVLGAALAGGSLVCVVGVDYAGKENPDGGEDGFYDEVWVGDQRIGWQQSSRSRVPWVFNSTGLEAVCGNRKLTIAPDLESVSFQALSAGSGTQNNLIDRGNGLWGLSRSGAWEMYHDFALGVLSGISLSVSESQSSSHTSAESEQYEDLDIKIYGLHHMTAVIVGDDVYAGEGNYTYYLAGGTGNCAVVDEQWSWPSGCGTGTITVTVTFEGGNVAVGTKQVRMSSGQWVLVSQTTAPTRYTDICGNIPCTCGCSAIWGMLCGGTVEVVSGVLRYVGLNYTSTTGICLAWPFSSGSVSQISIYEWQCP